MASRIQAINAYRPKINRMPSVGIKSLVEYIADRTGLNKGDIQIALSEFSSAIQFYNKQGQGVKLEGLGTYLPKINLKGRLSVSHRLDREISTKLNTPGEFTGEIVNRENIGKTGDELVDLWNTDNPSDLVT